MIVINIPENARLILKLLNKNGFESYVVGGCVRDCILGKEPKDWDICTSALPDQMLECFKDYKIIETGLKHGTITVVINGESYEVTTYRIDGEYSDNRRPDNVEFTTSLKEDLSRRDFTINAMAYNEEDDLIDYFGGLNDITEGWIKCVGDPDQRFQEDALRIMRAVRFASQLDFTVIPSTHVAMIRNKELLHNISVERICSELNKLLCGIGVKQVLMDFKDVIGEVIPELIPMFNFNQKNPYHIYDVWEHSVVAINNIRNDLTLRLTMFFHDIGKPHCISFDEKGIGHFYRHEEKSSQLAYEVMRRLRYDNQTIDDVLTLIKYHSTKFEVSSKFAKRMLNKLGEDKLKILTEVRMADVMAQTTNNMNERIEKIERFRLVLNEVIEQQQCFSLKDLAVNGWDLISIGVLNGKPVGEMLNKLLNMVIEDEIINDKGVLLDQVKILLYEI